MSFDVVYFDNKTSKFSWGSNCLPGEPSDNISDVPQGANLYMITKTFTYADGDTEFLAFNPENGNVSLWVFDEMGQFYELEILGKWDTPVVSKEEYEKMRMHAFEMHNQHELCEFDKYLKENEEN